MNNLWLQNLQLEFLTDWISESLQGQGQNSLQLAAFYQIKPAVKLTENFSLWPEK